MYNILFFSFLDGSESIQPSSPLSIHWKTSTFYHLPKSSGCIIIVWSLPNTRTKHKTHAHAHTHIHTRTSTVEKYGIRTVSVKITGKRRNERFSDWGSKLRLVCAWRFVLKRNVSNSKWSVFKSAQAKKKSHSSRILDPFECAALWR